MREVKFKIPTIRQKNVGRKDLCETSGRFENIMNGQSSSFCVASRAYVMSTFAL